MKSPIVAGALLALAIVAAPPAGAHGGEDHGHDAATPVHLENAARAYAESEDFELVAALQGERLLIYLDHWASNQPVDDAEIEIDGGGVRQVAQHLGAGLYAVPAAPYARPGRHALVFSIHSGDLADLLVAHLDVPNAAVDTKPGALPAWAAWSAVGGLLLAALAFAAWRRRTRALTDMAPRRPQR